MSLDQTMEDLTVLRILPFRPSLNSRVLVVGVGGNYADIPSALTAAALLTPTAASRVVVYLLPGTHVLTANQTFPAFTDLIGFDRDACIISATGATAGKLLYSLNVTFANFTFNYATTGAGAQYAIDRAAGIVNDTTGSRFRLQNVVVSFTNVNSGTAGACLRIQGSSTYIEMHDCDFLSSKYCITATSMQFVMLYNCNLWLLNLDTNTAHVGLHYDSGSGRIRLRNCQISTSYGPMIVITNGGITGEPDQNIYGVWVTTTGGVGSRVELYNVWSIVRNETGANAGVNINAIRNDSNNFASSVGIIRVFGGYFQAEDGGTDIGNRVDIINAGTANIQLAANVAFSTSSGRLDGMGGMLSSQISINTNTTLNATTSGIVIIDSSAGNVTVTLPGLSNADNNENYIFVRTSALNVVTISGGAANINGAATYIMPLLAYNSATVHRHLAQWIMTAS